MNKQPLYNWEVRVSRNKCSLVSFRLGINNKIGIRTLKFASSWEVRALTFEIVSPDLGLWERQGRDGWTYKMQGFDNVFRGWVYVGWELNKEINRKNGEMRMVAIWSLQSMCFSSFLLVPIFHSVYSVLLIRHTLYRSISLPATILPGTEHGQTISVHRCKIKPRETMLQPPKARIISGLVSELAPSRVKPLGDAWFLEAHAGCR